MKTIIATIGLLVIFNSSAFAGNWEWGAADYAREAVALGLTVVDWGQTRDIRHHAGMKELNPILGREPSDGKINGYFATVMILHPLVTAALPKQATILGLKISPRTAWQYFYIGVEATAISSNWNGGLRMRF